MNEGQGYSCALVDWFAPVSDKPDGLMGMWIVTPAVDRYGCHVQSVIPLESVVRGAHLIRVSGNDFIHINLHFSESLEAFKAYYVNKYIDHHAYTLA
ncbi:hypothetical protein BKA82DRAFT_3992231 [Pisolithus tinctorius]|nr:hypothetical protein BKA82DRAFT_3992231 [Pisolithus tinctorius]